MNKALLSICVLLLAQTSFAGHHEKSEKDTKTIIGYEILDGEKLEIVAGDASAIDIWVKYVEAHNTRDLETINSLNASDFVQFQKSSFEFQILWDAWRVYSSCLFPFTRLKFLKPGTFSKNVSLPFHISSNFFSIPLTILNLFIATYILFIPLKFSYSKKGCNYNS